MPALDHTSSHLLTTPCIKTPTMRWWSRWITPLIDAEITNTCAGNFDNITSVQLSRVFIQIWLMARLVSPNPGFTYIVSHMDTVWTRYCNITLTYTTPIIWGNPLIPWRAIFAIPTAEIATTLLGLICWVYSHRQQSRPQSAEWHFVITAANCHKMSIN